MASEIGDRVRGRTPRAALRPDRRERLGGGGVVEEIVDDDVEATFGERVGDTPSDPAAGAGDERDRVASFILPAASNAARRRCGVTGTSCMRTPVACGSR